MTPTPTETRACAIARIKRGMSSLLHALAFADSLAAVDTLTRAYAEQDARLAELRNFQPERITR